MNRMDLDENEQIEYQKYIDLSISILKHIFLYREAIKQLQSLLKMEENDIKIDDVNKFLKNSKRCVKIRNLIEANQKNLEGAYEIFDQYGACLDELEGYLDEETEEIYITKEDIVVKTYTFKCIKASHRLENVRIIVDFDDGKHSEYKKRELVAGKCPKCNVYYVMSDEVKRAQMGGVLLCRMVEEKVYRDMIGGKNSEYNEQSILMEYGYSVSKERGLSDRQRHRILAYIIDNELCPPTEILSFLRWFIETRSGNDRYSAAIDKWEQDRDFVRNYKGNNSDVVYLRK